MLRSLALVVLVAAAHAAPPEDAAAQRAAAPPLAVSTPDGFPVPRPGAPLELPREHGAHPAFRIEWWYITGHLFSVDGARHGFQATFFRNAHPDAPGREDAAGTAFGSQQVFLAHMAVTDTATGRFLHQERLNRSGWDATVRTGDCDVVNGPWSLRRDPASPSGLGAVFLLEGSVRGEAAFSLRLRAVKPPVVFGKDGVSRKGVDPTAASRYITFTRLEVEGSLAIDGVERAVTGRAWFDHEISSSQLGDDQVGWDWASLQLEDGREVMAYVVRRRDGTHDPFSTLAWIDREARVTHVPAEGFRWEASAFRTSPRTGAAYPALVTIRAPDPATGAEAVFQLVPFVADQELPGSVGGIPYWEGACRVLDAAGREVGSAYLELTGYAGDLSGRL